MHKMYGLMCCSVGLKGIKELSMSLRDQLLKKGLATKSQYQKSLTEKKQQKKTKKNDATDAMDQQVQVEMEEKKRQDQRLNQEREAERQKKSVIAEIQEWIKQHRVVRVGELIPYRFPHQQKIKTLGVSLAQRQQIVSGQLIIISIHPDVYELMPSKLLNKIEAKLPEAIVVNLVQKTTTDQVEDDYAGYDVPDDLIW